ncbi:glycosyl transferase family 1 [candidate division WOR-1 bacterium DG_54_3]|uniref:Glycosyl transferase family 1 n=1 Tax=candidate division WOR-1 bacterium DG_54_3 TaxID=1703775 RepID=A0A0S7Y5C2_UNCSA|nr:MAG: glycosyl transferase family 1 [candidate division WOR-1 bacterium DG_54_3]
MKILHILDHSLPLQSGYAFRSHNIFKEQQKRGWYPVVITSPKQEQDWKGPWENKVQIGGVTYYRTVHVKASQLLGIGELQLMRPLASRIQEMAKLEKPNILHAHSPILNAIPALWLGRTLNIPVIYEIRAFWEDAAVDHGAYCENSIKYRLIRSLETWVCRRTDQVVVLCNGLKEDLIERSVSPDKMTVVCNGINTDDFSSAEPDAEFLKLWKTDGKKIIGFIGSFYRYEGLDLLLQAFSRLAAQRRDVILLLVGSGETETQLKEQVKLLNLVDRVIMPGRIAHERIPAVYALVDVLAYPRYSIRLTDLVTPLKPLEAMAMGKVPVASDVGGHRELIRHGKTGFLFPAGNVSALADSLGRLLDDDSLRNRIQSHAAKWVRNEHTWEKTTSVYQDIYRKALDIRKI